MLAMMVKRRYASLTSSDELRTGRVKAIHLLLEARMTSGHCGVPVQKRKIKTAWGQDVSRDKLSRGLSSERTRQNCGVQWLERAKSHSLHKIMASLDDQS
jgi:hypothetical protein